MLMKTGSVDRVRATATQPIVLAAFVVCLIVGLATFSKSILELVRRWQVQEEYSHGFLIPVIVGWLLWTRRDALLGERWSTLMVRACAYSAGCGDAYHRKIKFIVSLVPTWFYCCINWHRPGTWRLLITQSNTGSDRISDFRDSNALFH